MQLCGSLNILGIPGGSEDKASACNAGDPGSIPGLGRSLGEGNGNPLQYSFLENPLDRGAWWATVHGVTKSQTRLSNFTSLHFEHSLALPFFGIEKKTNPFQSMATALFSKFAGILSATL